jgi:hypothetical protein
MGDIKTCGACHPADYCTRCHGEGVPHDADFVRSHGPLAMTPAARCETCHQPSFCIGCHGLEMPHPPAFTAIHSATVKARGEAVCLRCHMQSDCENCHTAHIHPGGATVAPRTTQ